MARIWNGPALLSLLLLVSFPLTFIAINTLAMESSPGFDIHPISKLRELAYKDFATANRLKSLINEKKNEPLPFLKLANRYLRDFSSSTTNESHVSATAHAEQCIRNPLVRFKVMRRMSQFGRALRKDRSGIQGLDELKNEFKDAGPGINSELQDAVDAILQIHFIYNLNVTELAAGKIGGIQTGVKLLAFNCLFIGYRAKVGGKYTLAVDWLKEALRLAKIDGTVEVPVVRAELYSVIQAHNWQWENEGLFDTNLFTRQVKSNIDDLEGNLKVKERFHAKYAGKGRNCSYWPMNTWALCSGQSLLTPGPSSHLFCWLEFKAHAVLTIGPLKMEFLSRNPDIVQIYDAFRASASADNVNEEDFKNLVAFFAISFNHNNDVPLVTTNNGSGLQMAQFLPGAASQVRVDSLPLDGSINRRDATIMLNLDNVEAGGYTVCLAAFATSMSTKGSATFWFNTLSDGSTDFSTAYVDCPVILGHKFVARKWLSFSHQYSKCLLRPKDRFQVHVNGKALPVPAQFHHDLITEQEYHNPTKFIALEGVPGVDSYEEKTIFRKFSYHSVHSLKLLMGLDWEIYQNVRRMAGASTAEDNNSSWSQVNSYLQEFEEDAYKLIGNGTFDGNRAVAAAANLASNPLAIYRTLWRFENYVKKWMTVEQSGNLPVQLRNKIAKVYGTTDGPTYTDLVSSIAGILVMQIVYDFDSTDIATGTVGGTDTGIRLSPAHCLQFGRQAIMLELWYLGVEWMEFAVEQMAAEGHSRMELEIAQMELKTARKAHDMHLQSNRGEDLFTFTHPVSRLENTRGLETNKEVYYHQFKLRTEPEHVRANYFGVCEGKPHQTAQEQGKLFCWLETQVDPYWKIGPLKAELLSMHPDKAEVVQFHDILTNELIQYLWNVTVIESQDFVQSATRGQVNPVVRLGASLWLLYDTSQESRKITKLVEKATGLRLLPSILYTALQIGTYSPGSHYDAHHDTVNYDLDGTSRIATFMFYLTDVEKGGATAFAQAGIRVVPKAGSAIFWYNLHSDGVLDDQTHHGACPVIFGEKLVATQWLHYADQDHLKCHIRPEKRIEVLVNGKSKYAA